MKLAIMQPYFFPYIGYFQLINAVDKFVFYDDVNFIKNGWINRNRILINNSIKYFSVQLKGASSNKLINKVEFTDNRIKLKKTILMSYKKTPMFNKVWPVIEDCLDLDTSNLSELAIYSVKRVCQYLNVTKEFEISSKKYYASIGMDKAKRLKTICKMNGADTYYNLIGGQILYDKEDFKKESIKLSFIKPKVSTYKQFTGEFQPGLSIIDLMMFNSVEDIGAMLNNYEMI